MPPEQPEQPIEIVAKPFQLTTTRADGLPPTEDMLGGMPLAEYTDMALTPCVVCGKAADDCNGGQIVKIEATENHVLLGWQKCSDCMNTEELETMSDIWHHNEDPADA